MNQRPPKYSRAKMAFHQVKSKHRLYLFYDLPTFPIDRYRVERYVSRCVGNGIGCIIPRLPANLEPSAEVMEHLRSLYEMLIAEAGKRNMKIGFHLEPVVERSFYMSEGAARIPHTRTRHLTRREYFCDPEEKLFLQLHPGALMSVMAYDDEHADMIDLRPYNENGIVSYTVPSGANWTVEQYLCTDTPQYGEPPIYTCNILSYDHSKSFLTELFDYMGNIFQSALGATITEFFVSDICFHGINRRDWDERFNEVFEKRFGFDPAPLYPALFGYAGKDTVHYKAMLMAVRASMIQHGIMQALNDFAKKMGLAAFGTLSEPKLTACSFTVGDAMLCNRYSPCALFDKAYLYGTNSVKIAASAAYNFDACVNNTKWDKAKYIFFSLIIFDLNYLLLLFYSFFAKFVNSCFFHSVLLHI